jgi:hypothetical protein
VLKLSNFEWSAGAKPIEDSSFEWSAGAKPIKSEESNLQKAARYTAQGARTLGANIAGFIPDTAGFLMDVATYPAAKLDEMLHDVPEKMQRKSFDKYNPHATEFIKSKIDELSGGYTKPQTEAEEIADKALDFASVLVPGAGLAKGVKKVAPNLKKLGAFLETSFAPTAENIGASLGAGAASKAYEQENSDDAVGSLLATLGGGIAGGLSTKLPQALKSNVVRHPITSTKDKIADVYAQKLGIDPEKLARNEALGLPVTASQVSAKPSTLAREEILRHHPASRNKFIESDVSREREIARNLGVSDPENLKQTIKNIDKSVAKEGAEGYKGRIGKIFEHYQEKFANRENQAIANRELVDVSDIHNELSQAAKGLKKTKELKDFENTTLGHFKKQIEEYADTAEVASIIKQLKKDGYPENVINQVIGQIPNEKKVGYAGLEALRKEAKNVKDSFKRGTEQYKDASRIYDMLSRKRHEFMETTGNAQEKHAAKRARKVYAQYAGDNEKLGQKNYKKYVLDITGSPNEANAFEKLISKDPKYLHVTRVGLPKNEQRRLGESLMEHLGKQQGRFNINKAHTRFDNLEPSIQAEFLQTLPKNDRKNFLDTMDLISENKQAIENIVNTSRSAHTLITHQAKDDIFKAASKGDVKGVLTQLMKNGLYRLDGYVYTDQTFLKRMADMAKARNAKELTNRTDLLLKSPVIKSAIRSSAANAKEDKKGSEKKKSPHITIYATQSGRPN